MSRVYSFEYVKNRIESYNYKVISDKDEYSSGSSLLIFSDDKNYRYCMSHNSFSSTIKNGKPLPFKKTNPYIFKNIEIWLLQTGRNWDIVSSDIKEIKEDRKIFFRCNTCNNEFDMSLDDLFFMNCKCPMCQRKRVSDLNSMSSIFPESLEYFYFEKNYPVIPEKVSIGSNKKIWWKCSYCNSIWEETPSTMFKGGRFRACCICNQTVLSDNNRLSKIRPDLLDLWDYKKNKKTLYEYSKGSQDRVFWECKKCGYSFCGKISDVVNNKMGCPSCSGRKLSDKNRLSVIYPIISSEWNYEKNIDKSPDNISFGCHYKAWWTCPVCQKDYECTVANRSNGRGCPYCFILKSQSCIATNLKLYAVEKYKAIEEYEIIKNITTNKFLFFDIFIPTYKIFIEINGDQHYRFIKHWHIIEENFESQKNRDDIKRKYAFINGYYLEIDLRKIKNIDMAIDMLENKIYEIDKDKSSTIVKS